ncbi:MAG: hypothetical protein ASARMPRED_002762 [Alectoria sarmentosa]|nr:MAG: hypothetical protein ASARMPRED_002762 [Alectoria sarmentosa]
MSPTLHKATITDLPTMVNLQFAAFQQSSSLERLIYPLGLTPSVLAAAVASRETSFHEPHMYYLKVVDSDLVSESGQMQPAGSDEERSGRSSSEVANSIGLTIAFARYYVWYEDREASTSDSSDIIRQGELGPPGEVNLDAHLGAGTMLIRWGLDLADREDLEVFLTSTPVGHSIYRKMGFEDIAAFDIDLGTLGATVENGTGGIYKYVLMRRGVGEGKRS